MDNIQKQDKIITDMDVLEMIQLSGQTKKNN